MLTFEGLLSSQIAEPKPKVPILVIEDDRALRMIFEWIIHDVDPHLKFDWCTSVEQAQRALDQNRYRLIFSDFMLEGMRNGLEIWELCNLRNLNAKFVMMSSLQLNHFCKVTGPNDEPITLIRKPLDVLEIQSIIRDNAYRKEAA